MKTRPNLHKEIVAKLLPINQSVHTAEEAQTILAQTGARLIIHGSFLKGKSKGKPTEGFTRISFTLSKALISSEDRTSLGNAFTIEDFLANEENGFWDKTFVSENLSRCACGIMGVCLTTDNRFEKARKIWSALAFNNQGRAPSPKVVVFNQFVSRWFDQNEFWWAQRRYGRKLWTAWGGKVCILRQSVLYAALGCSIGSSPSTNFTPLIT